MCGLQKSLRRPDYAARPAWEAEWDGDPDAPDDDGPTEAVIPTTDGPALVDLMSMSEGEWDAYTRGSAMRRAGYGGLRRNVEGRRSPWLPSATRTIPMTTAPPKRRSPPPTAPPSSTS
jgi:hypothetical protein